MPMKKLYFCFHFFFDFLYLFSIYNGFRVCHGRDRIVVGFSTTCAISAYHH